MQQTEAAALWRAVGVLVVVSVARWAWSDRGATGLGSGDSVLPALIADTRSAAAEGARRSEPLGEGERIDPNRASEVDLDRLPGVGPATARAIVRTREEGAVFRRPEDLLLVRGIGPAGLERIRASLDLSSSPDPPRGQARAERLVDVNRAGEEELQSLPGVGPALAARIVSARREQMFTSLDDLVRVRGIGPATVERLRPFAVVGPGG